MLAPRRGTYGILFFLYVDVLAVIYWYTLHSAGFTINNYEYYYQVPGTWYLILRGTIIVNTRVGPTWYRIPGTWYPENLPGRYLVFIFNHFFYQY